MTDLEIWLVNDDPAQLLVQKRLLGRFAATVWDFHSPTQLIAQAKKFGSCPNLVSDYHMPGLNGMELSQLWCEMHPNARVLLLSASNLSVTEQQQATFLPSNRVRVLTGFRIPELLAAAKEWFANDEIGDQELLTEVPVKAHEQLEFFDAEVHHKLQQIGGRAFLAKALKRFKDKTPERITNFRVALYAQDFKRAHREAHSLKGSCGIVGATQLMELADELELDAQTKDPASLLQEGLKSLEVIWGGTLKELDQSIRAARE